MWAHAIGVSVEVPNWVALALLKTGKAKAEDRATGFCIAPFLPADQLLNQIRESRPISLPKPRSTPLAIAIGTKPRRLQISPASPPAKCCAISRGSPRLQGHPQHPPGDATAPARSQGMAGHDQPFGGAIPETYGVPVEEIQNGIRNVVRQDQHRHRQPPAFTAAVREAPPPKGGGIPGGPNFDPATFNKSRPGPT